MPQRFLRPGITTSDRWNSVSFEAQSLYIRILTLVDDFGRYDARVAILHGQCFALRPEIKPQRTAGLRSELQQAGLIDVYTVDGREYLEITQWQERARSNASKFPGKSQVIDISTPAADGGEIPQNPASLVQRPSTIAIVPSTIVHRPAIKRQRTARTPLECAGFKEFWQAYPRKEAIADAEEAWTKNGCIEFLPQILAAITAWRTSKAWTEDAGRWIPHPASWLNKRRWNDELPTIGQPVENGHF
jgi:hypothetical protein